MGTFLIAKGTSCLAEMIYQYPLRGWAPAGRGE